MWSQKLPCHFSNILKILHTLNGDPYGVFNLRRFLNERLWSKRFCAERLQSLIRTLELSRLDEYSALQKVASFATLVSTYEKGKYFPGLKVIYSCGSTGFLLILEPFETDNATVPNPVFHFTFVSPILL